MDEDAKNAIAEYINSLEDMQQVQARALVSIFFLMYAEEPTAPNEKFDILKLMLDVYKFDILTNLTSDLLAIDEEELREQIALLGMQAMNERSTKSRILRNYASTLRP